jgi:hypothetical protein
VNALLSFDRDQIGPDAHWSSVAVNRPPTSQRVMQPGDASR